MTTKTRPETEPALVDKIVIAALLNCSPRHVDRMHDDGRMPAGIRLGRLLRWNREAIQKWIASGCPAPEKAV